MGAAVAKRRDPKVRPVEAGRGRTGMKNKDPRYHYVLVAPQSVGEYEFNGYEFVRADAGNERLNGVTTRDGEIIQFQDCSLMKIPLKNDPDDPERMSKEQLDKYGPDGETGWNLTDQIEAKIIDKRSAQADLMRGIKGAYGYVGVQSDVQPLRPEYGGATPELE